MPEKNANVSANLRQGEAPPVDAAESDCPHSASAPSDPSSSGLENVIAADTVLSRVDGERGELLLRGLRLESVAGVIPFEGTCQLLWTGDPTREIELLRSQLGRERTRAFEALPELGRCLERPDSMEAVRGAMAQLPETELSAPEDNVRITAAIAVFAAAWARLHHAQGPLPWVPPDPTLGHAEDYLRMIAGPDASDEPGWRQRTSALDRYLSTVAEHGMNASTFAARVVASTGSDRVSAVVAAICALKGPLHGGAPGPVLDMIDAIGEPTAARTWLEAELAAGRRIMGLGHRVYRVRDPRAAVVEAAIVDLRAGGGETRRLTLARAIEREAKTLLRQRHPGRPLDVNVEFYTAVLLDGIGLDRRLFSPTFAIGRTAGWLAHIDEQARTGRLIRPRSRYIGPLPEAG